MGLILGVLYAIQIIVVIGGDTLTTTIITTIRVHIWTIRVQTHVTAQGCIHLHIDNLIFPGVHQRVVVIHVSTKKEDHPSGVIGLMALPCVAKRAIEEIRSWPPMTGRLLGGLMRLSYTTSLNRTSGLRRS